MTPLTPRRAAALTPQQRFQALQNAKDPWKFPGMVDITRLDGNTGPIDLLPQQRVLLSFFQDFDWTYTLKYRQAASSIIHEADQLRHISYHPGQMGMIIGDKEGTYKELMRRLGIMYRSLPEAVKIPVAYAPSSETLQFDEPHNGLIQGLTGGGENPAVGFSPDYAIVSEFGLYQNFDGFNGAFNPAVNRRPNGIVRYETTPGEHKSVAQQMFDAGLAGDARWQSIFLPWWRDLTCHEHKKPMPSDFEPSAEEKIYAERLLDFEKVTIGDRKTWYRYEKPHPIGRQQLWFRHVALDSEFHGDFRLWDNKFPPDPWSGWLAGGAATIPLDPITRLLAKARSVPAGVEHFYEPEPERGCPYLITVDGKGYSDEKGDPAAITLWNLWDWSEAGTWSGAEDPGVITKRILRWQEKYNAHVCVETNNTGVAAALQTAGCEKLWWDGNQPGWWASDISKTAALNALVDLLRKGDVTIRTYETLDQLRTWDGKMRRQRRRGEKHHYDRAITCLIFAYAVQALSIPRRPRPKVTEPEGPLTARAFLGSYERKSKQMVTGDWRRQA